MLQFILIFIRWPLLLHSQQPYWIRWTENHTTSLRSVAEDKIKSVVLWIQISRDYLESL
jgi:hypothetical protein